MTKQCYYCSYPNRYDAERFVSCGQKLDKHWQKSGDRPKLIDEK